MVFRAIVIVLKLLLMYRAAGAGTVNYSMRPQTGTAVMVAPYLNNGMVQQFDCTASDGRFIRWYINGTIYLNTFSGSITVVVASINGSYSSYVTIPPMLYPLNVKCGDISGTYFSYNVTIVWILDPPYFNCSLDVTDSVISWDHCVNVRDYIIYYILNTTDSANGEHIYLNAVTMYTFLNLTTQNFACDSAYEFTILPVNVIGVGVGAKYTYLVPECHTSDVGTVSSPTVSSPTVPSPTVPSPTVSSPTVSSPTITVSISNSTISYFVKSDIKIIITYVSVGAGGGVVILLMVVGSGMLYQKRKRKGPVMYICCWKRGNNISPKTLAPEEGNSTFSFIGNKEFDVASSYLYANLSPIERHANMNDSVEMDAAKDIDMDECCAYGKTERF